MNEIEKRDRMMDDLKKTVEGLTQYYTDSEILEEVQTILKNRKNWFVK